MEAEVLLQAVMDYGYIILFLWLWLGMFIAPVPNEIIVSTVGFLSGQYLHPMAALLTAYIGIIASITTSYFAGRLIGYPVLHWLQRKGPSKSVQIASSIMDKYRVYSLSFSYFIPGVRNIVPFLFGMNRLPFQKFAMLAYSSAFVWCSIFFFSGLYFGQFSKDYPWEGIVFIVLLLGFVSYIGMVTLKKISANKNVKENETHHH
ncbi:DedA family protein [Alkalihalobacillus sp. LMS39]|uniref:DedA family protein n=1 Tax=Alkalihalobacillus sp. LMS39 TaxID=2924032 RepID=UPI001FB4FC72|nr:DedA family protein [Alkalihalobacillus sp. LMS39]UOE94609.1 DedA family protein [Alkalihalobacillus sp. LMS39]